MTDAQPPAVRPASSELDSVKLVYILYFVSLVVGITSIAGVIVAYLRRSEADEIAASHYTFQIRTFWIGLLFAAISVITMMIMIGMLLALATVVWFLIRSIKGFMLASDGKPVPDPSTWMW